MPSEIAGHNLFAPLDGWLLPLSGVPDPVFSASMMGAGVAIDPTSSTLVSPCDGIVIMLAPTLHSIIIRSDFDAELLLHLGIDTVAMKGQGFIAHVSEGQRVSTGDILISCDLDAMGEKAKSLITPIIITNSEKFTINLLQGTGSIRTRTLLMQLVPIISSITSDDSSSETTTSVPLLVCAAHGIHARPAATIAQHAQTFAATVSIAHDGKSASAKSVVALMGLGIGFGDTLNVTATGKDAKQAVASILQLMNNDIAKPVSDSIQAPIKPQILAMETSDVIKGTCAVPGLVIGAAAQLINETVHYQENALDCVIEMQTFNQARSTLKDKLHSLQAQSQGPASEIVSAHLMFVDDPELIGAAHRYIQLGKTASFAWHKAIEAQVNILQSLSSSRMRERTADLRDIENQLLEVLAGQTVSVKTVFQPGTVLIADDITPSAFIALDTEAVIGLCTAHGGPSSHVAILAASKNMPMLVNADDHVLQISDGTPIILDAGSGVLHINPSKTTLQKIQSDIQLNTSRLAVAQKDAATPCYTKDAVHVEVFANLGALQDADTALVHGAEGCGLLRNEFLFLDRLTAPSINEQTVLYQHIATALCGRPLIIRTMDIGGDKPVPYLDLPMELNPALGLRGIRTSLFRPDIFKDQLTAILAVKPYGQCRIMLPMVTSLEDVRAAKRLINEITKKNGSDHPVELGVMIETPASALIAHALAAEVDFLSIGTNDLTQYTLAIDRSHSGLATQFDSFHPAVLRMIAMAAEAGKAHNCTVAVCGSFASDMLAVPLLLGLGVTELSLSPAQIPSLKSYIRSLTMADCRALAISMMKKTSTVETRNLAMAFQKQHSQNQGNLS